MKHLKTIASVIAFMIAISSYAQDNYSIISNTTKTHLDSHSTTSKVVAEITITDSKTIEGYKNLHFKLNNGLSFTYEDGNCKAGYKNRSLDVKGKYSVSCEAGTLSLAFNADDGSIWWVFRPNDNS